MTVNKLSLPAKENAVQLKINEIIDNLGGGGTATDVQINGTSITSNNVANIVTNTAYNASSNKIATMSDIPANEVFIATYGTTFYQNIIDAYGDGKAVFVKYVDGIYPLVDVNSNYVSFCGVRGTIVNYITCDSSSVLGWSVASSYTAEQTSNKTTSLSGSSTNTQYPSAKCVYDELQTVKRNIGEIVTSTIPLTDAGLHLLDGTLLQYGSYKDFIDYIASIYDASANYFCSESDWQTSVTTYGVCGKFVYDSTNNTVRLPKITGFTEGTIDVTTLGDLTKAGMPNITGSWIPGIRTGGAQEISGAFEEISGSKMNSWGTSGTSTPHGFTFNASRSSSIYGNSTTVQPQSIKVLYYIVVANSTKTEIEVDIDDIATDLNNKADKDFVNINQTAKNAIINAMMPDYANGISYTYTTANTDQTYTMPNDGVLYYTLSSYNLNTKPAYIKVNGYTVNYMGSSGKTIAQVTIGNINVNKNDIITVNSYYTDDFLTKITFFPMKGAA